MTDAGIRKLIDGFGRFRAEHFKTEDSLYQRLTREGQSPRIMVIACCDSRVDPAIITDCDPGDLFVVRNVANLVPPSETVGHYHGTSAALEFAVRCLNVEDVIVLGHSRCGGIRALLSGIQGADGLGQFITPWMAIAAEARNQVMPTGAGEPDEEAVRACEQAAIRISLQNLLSFQWVKERVHAGRLNLHGWYFDMEHGQLLRYNPSTVGFELLG
jgi:carbonic anhydrase